MDLGLNIDIKAKIDNFIKGANKVKATLTGLEEKAGSMDKLLPPEKPPSIIKDGLQPPEVPPGVAFDFLDGVREGAEDTQKELDRVTEITKESKKALEDTFDGAALSLLFFGQQLQSVSRSISTTGVQAFNDVISRTTETSTTVDRLSGAFSFLQFRIGEALLPAVKFLTPIIASIADFVSENQGLVRNLVVTGTVLGTVIGTASALKLAYDAAADTVIRLGNAAVIAGESFGTIDRTMKNSKGKVSNLKKAMGSLVLATLPAIAVIATVTAGLGAFYSRLEEDEKNFTEDNVTFDILTESMNDLGSALNDTGLEFDDFEDVATVALDNTALVVAYIIDVLVTFGSVIIKSVTAGIKGFQLLRDSMDSIGLSLESFVRGPLLNSITAIKSAVEGDFQGALNSISGFNLGDIFLGSDEAEDDIVSLSERYQDFSDSLSSFSGVFEGLSLGKGTSGIIQENIRDSRTEQAIRDGLEGTGITFEQFMDRNKNMSVAPEGWNDSTVSSSVRLQQEQVSLQKEQREQQEITNSFLEESIINSTDTVKNTLRRETGMSYMELVNMEADMSR